VIAIPAIDLRGGACVQLVGGDFLQERVRLPNPIAVAQEWAECGFSRLHVVDLDAATGRGSNSTIIGHLLDENDLQVQVGGGLRSTLEVEGILEHGARYAVVSTRALDDLDWLGTICRDHPGQIIVAVDVRERQVVTRGWRHTLPRNALDLIGDIAECPVAALLVTSVHREGLMLGVDLRLMEEVVEATRAPVLAAGGVGSIGDLWALHDRGLSGAVIGMALYTGALDPRVVAQEFPE
jgi:phosphoribosylformimino-5-aminoimidazole carboxamide ribotide isomerase